MVFRFSVHWYISSTNQNAVLDFGHLDPGLNHRNLIEVETQNMIRSTIMGEMETSQTPESIAPHFTLVQTFYEIGNFIRAESKHGMFVLKSLH